MLQLLDSLADGMIEYLGDRRAVIGLSGGMDSALPLALLLRKGFRKIACFTYGAGRTRDVRNAHYLADSAGVDWEFVEYGKQTFESFGSPSWNAFSEIAHSCFRVPYEQDYFALERLLEKGTLDPERDVIISGFLGDHLGGSFHVFGHGQPGAGDVCGAILDKYVLRGMPQELNANLSGIFADPKCNLGRYQSWLAVHRHAGFILGGLEAFRFFGFDYYVPAMDHDWTDFWYGLDWSERLYSHRYRKGLLEGLFKPLGMGRAFREEAPLIKRLKRDIKGMVPVHVRARLKSVARAGEDVLGYKFLYGNIKSEVSGGGEQFYGNINLIHAAYLLERYSGPLK